MLEQRVGALHVGVDECAGIDDGSIDVALGSKVHDGAGTMLVECSGNRLGVADIGAHKLVALVFFERGEICGVAGVGEQVKIDDRRADRLDPAQHKIRTDKSGAAGNEDRVFGCLSSKELFPSKLRGVSRKIGHASAVDYGRLIGLGPDCNHTRVSLSYFMGWVFGLRHGVALQETIQCRSS